VAGERRLKIGLPAGASRGTRVGPPARRYAAAPAGSFRVTWPKAGEPNFRQLEPDVELAAPARQNATVLSNREHLRNVMMKTDFKS
jgi:hypothetical protein